MLTETEETNVTEETVEKKETSFRNLLKPGLILVGAFTLLMMKEYISAKLLAGIVLLDYFTYDLVGKLPMPVCFAIFMALTFFAFI